LKSWNSFEKLSQKIKRSVVTIGNFDGVHLGHQAIVRQLKKFSKTEEAPSILIMFDPHPSVILGRPVPPLLTNTDQRIELVKFFEVDHCVVLRFNKKMAETRAESFVIELLEKLHMKVLCIGPTTHIGRKREGTPEKLNEFSKKLKFKLVLSPPTLVENEVVSSSRIRKLIQEGKVQAAKACLGRAFCTSGVIKGGASRGKKIGFPTANLGPVTTLTPKQGVYATWIELNGKWLPSVTNIGTRPTVTSDTEEIIETHILDFEEKIQEKNIRLLWEERLRDEVKFPSVPALAEQISKDCESAKRILGELKKPKSWM